MATTDFAVALGAAGVAAVLGEAATGALFGPFGVLAGTLLLANHAMGPSCSATVPCVLHIASLRLQQKIDDTLGEAL
ncbi:MAG TPA: hypothetical protein VNC39_14210 [Acidocella sp.]|uniref:hypothetical protein n=1 Tax=Acidocella sp. TaxID=50710 RepID=UPI002B6A4A41|nr:hypothetical protein [Acidocella sp.]HVE23120.1 hypothetical protein [Acidocella sp.]